LNANRKKRFFVFVFAYSYFAIGIQLNVSIRKISVEKYELSYVSLSLKVTLFKNMKPLSLKSRIISAKLRVKLQYRNSYGKEKGV